MTGPDWEAIAGGAAKESCIRSLLEQAEKAVRPAAEQQLAPILPPALLGIIVEYGRWCFISGVSFAYTHRED